MGLEGSAGSIRRRGGESARSTGRYGEGGGGRGMFPALSVFIMIRDAAMLCRRIHSKMRFRAAADPASIPKCGITRTRCFLGDTSLTCSHNSLEL